MSLSSRSSDPTGLQTTAPPIPEDSPRDAAGKIERRPGHEAGNAAELPASQRMLANSGVGIVLEERQLVNPVDHQNLCLIQAGGSIPAPRIAVVDASCRDDVVQGVRPGVGDFVGEPVSRGMAQAHLQRIVIGITRGIAHA